MLQTFDEGRLTDGKGTTIDCREAVFILTSNLAQQEIADEAVRLREDAQRRETQHLHTAAATSQLTSAAPPQNGVRATGAGGEEAQSELLTKAFKRDVVQPILRSHFGRDEFLGRINEIVFFLPFTAPERHALAEAELRLWADRAAARHRMSLNWTPRVCERIGDDDYDLRYGARSIKYAVDRRCIGPIAKQHEVGGVGPGCYMRLRGVEEPPLDRCPVSSSASDRQGRSTDAAPAQEPTSYPAGHGLVLDVCLARSGGDYLTGEAQVSTKKGGLLRKLFG
jgi:ATP-dependent Clp protease ATP-binding subunit ClpB